MEGFLFIDKPSGPTSHDVADRVRAVTGVRRVGHAGTLDPFATGLLIVGIGKATKEMQKLVGLDKGYEATLRLGATSNTYDRTGTITKSDVRCQMSDVLSVLKKFTGTLKQVPPMYSAKKVRGKKLYELARKGIEIERKPIQITIYKIELLQATSHKLQARIRCSSGTYIRSLAHDIGQALGCSAYLEELRRTVIGPFRIENAVALATLHKNNVASFLKSIPAVLDSMPKPH